MSSQVSVSSKHSSMSEHVPLTSEYPELHSQTVASESLTAEFGSSAQVQAPAFSAAPGPLQAMHGFSVLSVPVFARKPEEHWHS